MTSILEIVLSLEIPKERLVAVTSSYHCISEMFKDISQNVATKNINITKKNYFWVLILRLYLNTIPFCLLFPTLHLTIMYYKERAGTIISCTESTNATHE